MSIRKFSDLANETDSRFNNVKSTKKRAKITERFDDTTHNPYPGDEAVQFLNKKLDQVSKELNCRKSQLVKNALYHMLDEYIRKSSE